jgi:hypothetical protein
MEKNKMNDALDLGAWIGRKQAFALLAGKCSAADAECLRTIKDSKKYKSLGLSWAEFSTQHLGISRVAAEKIISLLNEFGPQYFELSAVVRITPEDYRRIAPAVTPQGVQHRGRVLEIGMHNAPELSEAVQELRQQTETVVVEQVSADDFDCSLERTRRSSRTTLDGFRRLMKMDLGEDRRSRLFAELRRSTQEVCALMKQVAEHL